MWNHTGNILLHTDDVGKPKPPSVRLPPKDHCYGSTNQLPENGVRELLCWSYHQPTPDAEQKKDFTQVNIRPL